jgi:Cys-tRNA(Pro) deacylase
VETAWPEPVERVSSYLREAGAEARIEQFAADTPTASDAASAVGCELAQIVKSIVLLCDGRPVLALVPGDRRGDPAKIALAAGAREARMAPARDVQKATGYTPGAVSPFGIIGVALVLLDPTLLRHETVWVGGGTVNHLVGLAPAELARLTRARTMDVVQDHPYDFASGLAGDLAGGPPGDRDDPKER